MSSAFPPSSPAAPPRLDDPRAWLHSTPLLDLDDPKLRLKACALTQLCKSEREKALAVYGFVKRLPLSKRFKLRLRTAREVLDAGTGDADDKATLLMALLRAAGIPARLRYVELDGAMLRGLVSTVPRVARPLAEVWLGRWVRTDTYIFDAGYMAAARQRLKDQGWASGYGIHVAGHGLWNGAGDAFLGGAPTESDAMVRRVHAPVSDPQQALQRKRSQYGRVARHLHWNVVAPHMGRVIRALRDEARGGISVPAR